MHDTTVSGMPCVRKPAAIVRHEAAGKAMEHADDELLARLLVTSWRLATGRTLPAGVPPHLLSEDELISFWADDQVAAAGPASPAAVALRSARLAGRHALRLTGRYVPGPPSASPDPPGPAVTTSAGTCTRDPAGSPGRSLRQQPGRAGERLSHA